METSATVSVTAADLRDAHLGPRFGRLDLMCQLAVLAVERLGVRWDALDRARVGICLVAKQGSLSTDAEYWNDREAVGGPSPTLFAYTLPSAAAGEIAIRYKLMGPNVCLVGNENLAIDEGAELLRHGEADACLCVFCDVMAGTASDLLRLPATACASAVFLRGNE